MNLHEYLQQPWLYYTLVATYALSVFTVIAVILGENRNPVKSLAWVTILLLLPAVGLLFYFFFGRNIRNKRMLTRRDKRRLRKAIEKKGSDRIPRDLTPHARKLSQIASTLNNSRHLEGNSVEIFSTGAEKFAALKRDLLAATCSINMQYYIIESDRIGSEIAQILKQKAAQGVKVRVIYDHVGSLHTNRRFFSDLQAHGVKIYPFFKVNFAHFGAKMNWRNHRKIVVIDNRIGYIGGMNIADRYIDGDKKFETWRDCHLRITGPSVRSLQYAFAYDWSFMGRDLLEYEEITPERTGNVGLQCVTSGPISHWQTLSQLYLQAISVATKRVWIQTPYFLPPDHLLRALQNAALGGVDVRIMLPRHCDAAILGLASRSYFAECLRSGIKLYFYERGMLHSKVMIIDDDLASVGSTNFDFRSFEYNFEANLLIYSEPTNGQLQDIFKDDLKHSKRIVAEEWKKRPLLQRSFESFVRLLAPVM